MRHLWADWTPRVADYWHSFSAPYRVQITDLIDKHTPPNGSVMDFGCGVGVQTFLLRQRRPDLTIHAIDCNAQSRNFARILMGPDDKVYVEDTPAYAEKVPEVDTVVSVFTCAYIKPEEIGRLLMALRQKAQTLILAEPTTLEDEVRTYAGMPMECYAYPYGIWLERLGDTVETVGIEGEGMLNAVTVAAKSSSPEEP